MNFLKFFKKDIGIGIYGNFVAGDLMNIEHIEKAETIERVMINEIKKKKLRMIVKNEINNNYENGMIHLIYSAGLGPLNPNTILLSWPQSSYFLKKK